ncbi:MAG: hypothetical protein B6I24_10815 [Bacteroidetes bacterium 4572_128]|nr:MAG: hypothetical protein B6I24_10815 [Bacteroidetes bacterium 4572_128]
MLKLNSLFVKAEIFFLKNISLHIEKEKINVIIGETGSGKTILLETIIGLRKIQNGSIFFFEKNLKNIPIEKRKISYVPQDLSLFPHLNVRENIFYSKKIDKNKKFNKKFADKLIKKTGIGHLLNREIKNLSGGEKQRVALLRALVSENKLLILDEPFSAINETIKNELRFFLKEIQKEFKLTILFVTHDLDEAFFLGDKITIISNGKILRSDTKKELYYNPIYIEIAEFLGITNIFNGKITEINDKFIKVKCTELKSKILILNKKNNFILKINDKIKFGIRKSDIIILRENLIKNTQNIFKAFVDLIIEKVSFCDIRIKMKNSDAKILIETPIYAFNKLNIFHKKEIKFTLKSENIFFLKNI